MLDASLTPRFRLGAALTFPAATPAVQHNMYVAQPAIATAALDPADPAHWIDIGQAIPTVTAIDTRTGAASASVTSVPAAANPLDVEISLAIPAIHELFTQPWGADQVNPDIPTGAVLVAAHADAIAGDWVIAQYDDAPRDIGSFTVGSVGTGAPPVSLFGGVYVDTATGEVYLNGQLLGWDRDGTVNAAGQTVVVTNFGGSASYLYMYDGTDLVNGQRIDQQGAVGPQGMPGVQGPQGAAVTIHGNLTTTYCHRPHRGYEPCCR